MLLIHLSGNGEGAVVGRGAHHKTTDMLLKCSVSWLAAAQDLPSSLNSRSPKSGRSWYPEVSLSSPSDGSSHGLIHKHPELIPHCQGDACFLYSSLTENGHKNIKQDAVEINEHFMEDRYWTKERYKQTLMKRYERWDLWSPTRVRPRLGWAQVQAKYTL